MLLFLLVACQGEPPTDHFDGLCEPRDLYDGSLVMLEQPPPRAPETGIYVAALSPTASPAKVAVGVESLRVGLESHPGDGHDALTLFVDPTTPVSELAAALAVARGGGMATVHLAVHDPETRTVPPLPDPAYAEALRRGVLQADDSQAFWTEAIAEATAWCPATRKAFERAAASPWYAKCPGLTADLEAAIPSCPWANQDQLLTLVRVLYDREVSPHRPGNITLILDPEGTAVSWAADETWADLAPRLLVQHNTHAWIDAHPTSTP